MKEYNKQLNHWKAKTFFLSVLRSEGRKHVISDKSVEELATILAERLIQKVIKETK
jgi:hypothetical protein